MTNEKSHTTDEFSQNLGRNLRRIRCNKGLTQKAVASVLSVSFQQIQKYETGQNRIPIEKLLTLKVFYGIDFESFFKGSNVLGAHLDQSEYTQAVIKRLETLAETRTKAKIINAIDILISA